MNGLRPQGGLGRRLAGYVGLSLAWLAILGVTLVVTRRPSTRSIEILPPPTPAPTATRSPSPTPGPLRVDVAGAVRAPGVYALPPGSLVVDAIAAAGGPADDADVDRVNKAVALQDGIQIYVPRRGQPASGSQSPTSGIGAPPSGVGANRSAGIATASGLVNLNTATLEELDTLPGIGPSLGRAIIEGRPYGVIEDVVRVQGIGPATFEKLKDLVTVR